MESRIWLVDNSLQMKVKDCCLIIADDKMQKISREEGASRWSEQMQCVDFHMKMAARAWIPTKASLVCVQKLLFIFGRILINEPDMLSYSSGCQTNLIVKHSNTVYVGETQKNGLRNETVLRLY